MKFSSVTISRKVTCVSFLHLHFLVHISLNPLKSGLCPQLSGIISAGLIQFLAAKFKMLFWYLL